APTSASAAAAGMTMPVEGGICMEQLRLGYKLWLNFPNFVSPWPRDCEPVCHKMFAHCSWDRRIFPPIGSYFRATVPALHPPRTTPAGKKRHRCFNVSVNISDPCMPRHRAKRLAASPADWTARRDQLNVHHYWWNAITAV
ncbi:hypothetical protein J6590_102693, partial [Homalodisca vitripennis]